jgi:hypothetical protein
LKGNLLPMPKIPAGQTEFDEFIRIIAEGGTVRQAADSLKVSPALICKWLAAAENANLREQYARAREAQGDAYADKVIETAEDKNLDAAEKRVRMDAYKWAAGKRKPKVYGDRLTAEHTGANGGPIQHSVDLSKATEEQLAALEALILPAAVATGATSGGDPSGEG